MPSSEIQAAVISGAALLGSAFVLSNAFERAAKTLAESIKPGSVGLAKLGEAVEACTSALRKGQERDPVASTSTRPPSRP
ncbi:hypothetical protein COHA_010788 [Chlorella ohadii]|uniref:Uncharacterized protein n=1 Tax=Chlorella ohadii TaxID=2649997 RepID=A0AAD5H063_9CHLO|nr:hypothetical protein COHA_010788 [Chlorella ohadii]